MPFYSILAGAGVQPFRVGGPSSSGARYVARQSDGTLWVAFTHRIDLGSGLRAQIVVAYSLDGGLTWTAAYLFPDDAVENAFTRILIDSEDTLHLTCERRIIPGAFEKYHTYKPKGGTWQAFTHIYSGMAQGYMDWALDSADTIHRVGAVVGDLTLRYDYKPYGGAWQANVILDTGAWGAWSIRFANICVDDNNDLHVTYTKLTGVNVENIFYISRVGGVWGVPLQLTTNLAVDTMRPISIAVMDGIVYSGYEVLGAGYRCLRRSAAGVWTDEAIIGGGTGSYQGHLTVNPDGTVHFIFHRSWGADYWYYEHERAGGVWNGTGVLYNWAGGINSYALGGLWANWPQIGGIRTNIPYRGWCCVAGRETELDVAFYIPPGGVIFPPNVTTDPATDIRQELATLNGTLDDDGGEACNCGFQWGLTVAYGNTTPTQSKVTGESFSQVITGLSCGTIYHFRALATNSAGTIYGADGTFTTLECPFINKAYALAREEL